MFVLYVVRCCHASMQGKVTPLHQAALNGHLECLRELLGRGAAVDHASEVITAYGLLC